MVGIDKTSIYEYIIEETEIKKSFIQKTKRVLAVADHTKLGGNAFAKVCSLEDIQEVVTDKKTMGMDSNAVKIM